MIDFNGIGPQGAGVGVIPPDSMVWVKLHIQMPQQGLTGSAVELTRAKSGSTMEFLSTKLEVQQGQYKGAKFFHRFSVGGASAPGQKRAVDIAMKQLCAILEVARNIAPDDASPQATEARRVNGWGDFEGMTFPCKVGCEAGNKPKDNDPTHFFVNNVLTKIVTRGDSEFSSLSQPPYELISALPVPEFPVGGAAPAAPAQQAWGAPQAQAAPAQSGGWSASPAQQTPPPPTSAPTPGAPAPAWAQPAPAQQAAGDSVPF